MASRLKCPTAASNLAHSNSNQTITFTFGKVMNRLIFSSLPLFLGPLWPGVAASDRVLSMGQIQLFDI